MGEASEVVIPLFGVLDITGEVLLMWAICLVLVVVSAVATRRLRERPGRLQNVLETGIEYLDGFFTGLLGKRAARKYFYFLGSLFIFIIFSNYSGLIPGVGLTPYFKAPTSSLSVTVGLGLLAFVFLQLASLRARGGRGYLKRFITPVAFMLPLRVLGEFIKPASLALRLFGNIYGEESVMEQLYELLPVGAPLIMMILSLLFCAIQAVVFTMLTAIYIDGATGGH